MPPSVSIVIPVYNGASTLGPLVARLVGTYGETWDLEIILVNDGSVDDSRSVCCDLVAKHPGVVRFLQLSRNFGEHAAVLAGLRRTSGDAVVVMDDDFQNPPEEVGALVEALRQGDHDVVYARFEGKAYSWWRRLGSGFNDRVANILIQKPKGLYLSSFKCMNRFVVGEVCRYEGPYPYLDGLILRVTRDLGLVLCERKERAEGESGYTLRKLTSLWLNMFTNFSILPLRAAVVVGFAFAAIAGVLSIGVVIEKLLIPETQVGWASLSILVMLFAGIQLMVLGVIGEYLGRQFLSVNGTPQSTVREEHGFNASPEIP